MARALQLASGRSRAVRMMYVGMQFVRAGQLARPRHRHGVAPARAAFGGEQVVLAVALVEVRAFGEAERRALEDRLAFADQLALRGRVFLQHDAGEAIVARAGGPRAC